jgi:tetratricopeptide (TPR) repeat protein
VTAANEDTESVAVAHRALGLVATGTGDLSEAARQLRVAIAIAEQARLSIRAAEARGTLSYVLTLNGNTDAALHEIELATDAVADGYPGARLRMNRALVLTELSRFDEAAAGYQDALDLLHRAGGDELIEADMRTNRSILGVYRRDWRGVENDLQRAERLYLATGHHGRTAMVYHNRGFAASVQGDLPTALAAFDEAAERYRAAGRPLGLLPVEKAEALLSVRLGAEALQTARQAVAEYAQAGNAVDLVQGRLVLAQAALLEGDTSLAAAEALRAGRSATRQHRAGWAALASYVALRARWQSGERTAGTIRAGRRAVRALAEAGWAVEALDARLIVARTALDLGRTGSARRQLTDAATARSTGPAELRARAWHATALLRLSDGDDRGAQSALRAGMGVLENFRASLGATELRAHASGQAAELAGLGLRLAIRSGRAESALRWAERWRASTLRLRPVRPPGDARLAQDLAELRQVVSRLNETAASGETRTDTRPLLRRQAALEERVRNRARHATGDASLSRLPSVPELGTVLTGHQRALVEYIALDDVLYAATVAFGRTRLHRLGSLAEAARELEALRFGLRRLASGAPTASLEAAGALVGKKAQLLDALLFSPLHKDIGDAALVVVPTGPLHAMPWPVLPTCAGRPLSVCPSAALWHRAATAETGPGGARVFAAGPGLAHAVPEVTDLAASYGQPETYTGERAAVDAVTKALDGAAVAHIAAHGDFRADNPLFSALQLADGPLTVLDIERLRRPPAHVVLSACDSGLPSVHPGDEIVGLAAALLALGTANLVATVVPVPDRTTAPLMLRYHQGLRSGRSPSVALAAAQRIDSAHVTPEQVADAGFLCFGAG